MRIPFGSTRTHPDTGGLTAEDPAVLARSRLPSLTGMRAVAAFIVAAQHFAEQPGLLPEGERTDAIRVAFSAFGAIGVSFFFVLSGFVLTWTAAARPDDTAPRFWRRRFFKIYPNHVVTMLIAAAFILWERAPGAAERLSAPVEQLLLVHAFSIDPLVAFGFTGVSWSLSAEAFFYLSFPLLLPLVNRIPAARLWAATGGVLLLILAVPSIATLLPDEPAYPWYPSAWEYWFVAYFPVVKLLEFLLGVLLARLVLSQRWIRVPLPVAAGALVLCLAASPFVPTLYGLTVVVIIGIALIIPAGAMADIEREPSFLRRRSMVWLGDISFAFYLLHTLALQFPLHIWTRMNGTATVTSAVVLTFLGLGVGIISSWLLFQFVEKPMQRRFSSSAGKPKSSAGKPESNAGKPESNAEEPASSAGKPKIGGT
jgi:peptidoglycan/LPS O-acetylase OafA/YrhL